MCGFNFFKKCLVILSLFLCSFSVIAYDGLELGHNEKYAPKDISLKTHYMSDLSAACMLATATYNNYYQKTAPNCGMEATGAADYSPWYGINCFALNYCIRNGVREDYPPAAGYIRLDKAICAAVDSQGNCITAPKPENDCAQDPNCDNPECPVGNPIYPSSGKKIQKEIDLAIGGESGFTVSRTYTHLPKPPNQNVVLAQGYWKFDLAQRQLKFGVDYSASSFLHQVTPQICVELKIANCVNHYDFIDVVNYKTVHAFRPDGSKWIFRSRLDSQGLPTTWPARHYPHAVLQPVIATDTTITGWLITLNDGSTESYSLDGELVQINPSQGLPTIITRYLDIDGITNITQATKGTNALRFYRDAANRIIRASLNDSQFVNYEYLGDSALIKKVIFQDNSSKTYLYENAQFPQALTGIDDERGVRYATWQYDFEGRAISSEHAGTTEKTLLDYSKIYDQVNPKVTVTNALGKKTSYYYSLDGFRNVIRVEGQPTANCAGANQDYTYTPEGWLASKTDWKGIKTTYQYNALGQETSRTEAFGTPEARTITTEWHPSLYLKTKVTEPDKETTFNYDANGRLLNQSVRTLTN